MGYRFLFKKCKKHSKEPALAICDKEKAGVSSATLEHLQAAFDSSSTAVSKFRKLVMIARKIQGMTDNITVKGIIEQGLAASATLENDVISVMTNKLVADSDTLFTSEVKQLLRDAAPGFNKIVQWECDLNALVRQANKRARTHD